MIGLLIMIIVLGFLTNLAGYAVIKEFPDPRIPKEVMLRLVLLISIIVPWLTTLLVMVIGTGYLIVISIPAEFKRLIAIYKEGSDK